MLQLVKLLSRYTATCRRWEYRQEWCSNLFWGGCGWVCLAVTIADTHNTNRAGWKLPLVVVLGNDVIANHTVDYRPAYLQPFTQSSMHNYQISSKGHTMFNASLLKFFESPCSLWRPQLAAVSHTHQDPLSRGGSVSRWRGLNQLWGERGYMSYRLR